MKRIIALISLLCISLGLSACALYESHQLAEPLPPAPTESPTLVPSKTPRPSRTPYPTPSPRPTPGPEPTIPPKPVLPTGLEYVNEARGYKLTFPESFRGYYYVNDENPDCLGVYFYGKSKSGTIAMLDSSFSPFYGLFFCYIMSETAFSDNHPVDNKRYLGTAGGKKYYFATSTDVSTAPVRSPKEPYDSRYKLDETELALAKEDSARVSWMYDTTKDIIFTPLS